MLSRKERLIILGLVEHLDTWFTLVLLTLNILTLLPYTSFHCNHKNVNYVNHDPVEAEELESINFRSSWSKPLVKVLEAFNDAIKLVETFGLVESVR